MSKKVQTQPKLLIVDDDDIFCSVLSKSLRKRNFEVRVAENTSSAETILQRFTPNYAIVDLNMPGNSGLTLIPTLNNLSASIKIVVLTGFASITTAVEAIKLGATQYLTKPADIDEILSAFDQPNGNPETEIASKPMTVNRVEWEHLQKVLNECEGNISKAARELGMHRRTLQRKLQKNPVKE